MQHLTLSDVARLRVVFMYSKGAFMPRSLTSKLMFVATEAGAGRKASAVSLV